MSQRLVPHPGASRVELPKPGIYMAGEWAYRPVGTRARSSENQFVLRDRHPLEPGWRGVLFYSVTASGSRLRTA